MNKNNKNEKKRKTKTKRTITKTKNKKQNNNKRTQKKGNHGDIRKEKQTNQKALKCYTHQSQVRKVSLGCIFFGGWVGGGGAEGLWGALEYHYEGFIRIICIHPLQ